MPRKTINGTTATIDEVIELHELGSLAVDWSRSIGTSGFSPDKFGRYQKLCEKYGLDAAALLYVYQGKRDEEMDAAAWTGVIPVIVGEDGDGNPVQS